MSRRGREMQRRAFFFAFSPSFDGDARSSRLLVLSPSSPGACLVFVRLVNWLANYLDCFVFVLFSPLVALWRSCRSASFFLPGCCSAAGFVARILAETRAHARASDGDHRQTRRKKIERAINEGEKKKYAGFFGSFVSEFRQSLSVLAWMLWLGCHFLRR